MVIESDYHYHEHLNNASVYQHYTKYNQNIYNQIKM